MKLHGHRAEDLQRVGCVRGNPVRAAKSRAEAGGPPESEGNWPGVLDTSDHLQDCRPNQPSLTLRWPRRLGQHRDRRHVVPLARTLREQTIDRATAPAGEVSSAVAALNECAFCSLESREQVIETSNVGLAVPSLGAFIDGWLLIVPKRHMLSLAEMSRDECEQFKDFATHVRQRLEQMYGPAVEFEHGSAGSSRSAGCGVDHAHSHLVPFDEPLRPLIAALGPDFDEMEWSPLDENGPCPDLDQDYITICDSTGSWITYSRSLPGQVVRRALAEWKGEYRWDWKANLHQDRAVRTLASLVGTGSSMRT